MTVACAALGEVGDLDDAAGIFGLKSLEPICTTDHQPRPIDLTLLELTTTGS
jgi:hypothetical protein